MTDAEVADDEDEDAGPPRPLWPWVAGVVVLAVVAAVSWFLVLRGDDGAREVVSTTGGEIGRPARDGRFVFTVTAVRCGVDRVGDEYVNLEPKGTYCLLDVTVKNGARTPELFDSNSQKAYDAAGTEFSTDIQAEVFVNNEARNFLDEIAPGSQVKGSLVFDVPDEATLTTVVLHESFSSPGARISLR
ncbi:hypothetical protein Aab01nite_75500 [Paractinoplanes abujensis]|uniref:DUF4352 domain-containing protein n=1 Tax=Paractinoplanes abujensis TaxID=882441 RepID=A0A7W7CVL0_9ACTN|nr:DUF4352 domain-containing protein [Actinoplanes abujensis]MBB4695224.1 hypothetical protein [Actinoplanes abujensis]GID23960.1 hypothetical protein Aab01nite_75500 [Actinoplanes abujensis]